MGEPVCQMSVIMLFLPPPGADCQLWEISITPVCNWLSEVVEPQSGDRGGRGGV